MRGSVTRPDPSQASRGPATQGLGRRRSEPRTYDFRRPTKLSREHVRVLHIDGTMAVYAHLQPESVMVHPGQRVRVGQRLGASGNTGFSTGPHLHFSVQANVGMEIRSVPFALEGPGGAIAIPGA